MASSATGCVVFLSRALLGWVSKQSSVPNDLVLVLLHDLLYFRYSVPENFGLDFISIHSSWLKKANPDYRSVVDYLKGEGILLVDEQYVTSKDGDPKTKAYAIAPEYRPKEGEKLVHYQLHKFKRRNSRSTIRTTGGLRVDYSFLTSWLIPNSKRNSCLHINSSVAKQKLTKLYEERRRSAETTVANLRVRYEKYSFASFTDYFQTTLASYYKPDDRKHPLSKSLYRLGELRTQKGRLIDGTTFKEELGDCFSEISMFLLTCADDMRRQQLAVVNQIQTGSLSYSVDSSGYRLHTTLCQLKKELRQFVQFRNKSGELCNLSSIDIKNSQPFLATALLNPKFLTVIEGSEAYFLSAPRFRPLLKRIKQKTTRKERNELKRRLRSESDVVRFLEDVHSGEFYERMVVHLGGASSVEQVTKQQRSEMKELMFLVLFSSENYHHSLKRKFASLYPTVHEVFNIIKRGKKNELALLLQSVESYLVIDVVCRRIAEMNKHVPLYTIHDSIVTLPCYRELVVKTMEEEFEKHTKYKPKLAIEPWSPSDSGDNPLLFGSES